MALLRKSRKLFEAKCSKAIATASPLARVRFTTAAKAASLWRTQHRVDENLLRAKLPLLLTSHKMDQEIKNEFKSLRDFLNKNMVTKQELEDLRVDLPTRAEFSRLQTSVDGIAKQFQDQRQEQIVGAARTARMEAWIVNAANKIGLEYKP